MKLHDDQFEGENLIAYHQRKQGHARSLGFAELATLINLEQGCGWSKAARLAGELLGVDPLGPDDPKEFAKWLKDRHPDWGVRLISNFMKLKYGFGGKDWVHRTLDPEKAEAHRERENGARVRRERERVEREEVEWQNELENDRIRRERGE